MNIEQFQQYRPLLFSIAYRMLGSVAEAEDVLQAAASFFAGLEATSAKIGPALRQPRSNMNVC
jgi:RNA polymerase sigma-70 factor (ECF subfamily)